MGGERDVFKTLRPSSSSSVATDSFSLHPTGSPALVFLSGKNLRRCVVPSRWPLNDFVCCKQMKMNHPQRCAFFFIKSSLSQYFENLHQWRKNLTDRAAHSSEVVCRSTKRTQKTKTRTHTCVCVLFPATHAAPKVTAPIRLLLFIPVTSPALVLACCTSLEFHSYQAASRVPVSLLVGLSQGPSNRKIVDLRYLKKNLELLAGRKHSQWKQLLTSYVGWLIS